MGGKMTKRKRLKKTQKLKAGTEGDEAAREEAAGWFMDTCGAPEGAQRSNSNQPEPNI